MGLDRDIDTTRKEEAAAKYCPVNKRWPYCDEARCAWYLGDKKRCAITEIAVSLSALVDARECQ